MTFKKHEPAKDSAEAASSNVIWIATVALIVAILPFTLIAILGGLIYAPCGITPFTIPYLGLAAGLLLHHFKKYTWTSKVIIFSGIVSSVIILIELILNK